MQQLRVHRVRLSEGRLTLRPMTERDWETIRPWNNDPEVLYYWEGDDVTSRPIEAVQELYRTVSQSAYIFIIELDDVPIGDCWLQEMNLPEILDRYPGMDLRRIDLAIGKKELWGKGWGSRVIGLLTRFGFQKCGADAIFGCGVGDYNPRSRRAFEKNGYKIIHTVPQPPGRKAGFTFNLMLTRERYYKLRETISEPK
ncbi:MAG TPA: GNAT family N-acetyltransferase [Candidatus Hydrogenedentes bacterium]|nr:GNAT family N-acetyltransferase [Candidatus Hydrogenedentota bacterium]